MKIKRIFLTVLDSVGIGAAPDAHLFGDTGANTVKRISLSQSFNAPNLVSLGLSSIEGVEYLGHNENPRGAYGRLEEISRGKDTTVGHWELMGLVSAAALPTYPNGFPKEIIESFEKAIGRGVLCNLPYSGTEVIEKYGKEHIETGKPIVYTSADSVFQIAAHEDIIDTQALYEYCLIARKLLCGKHGVGRVIARPFKTENGKFKRTDNRRDFSLTPPEKTALDAISEAGLDVISIGKINDIFNGQGITEAIPSHSNTEGIKLTLETMERDFTGLCFTNLVDFDMLYGHRQDIDGYALALSEFDKAIPKMIERLKEDDLLIITADHGCDPGDQSTDHTREYVPLLIYGKRVLPQSLGTMRGFGTVGATICELLGVEFQANGANSIAKTIIK